MIFDGCLTVLVQNDLVQVQAADGGDGHGVVDEVGQLLAKLSVQVSVPRHLSAGAPVQDFSDLAHFFHQFHEQPLLVRPVAVLLVQILL